VIFCVKETSKREKSGKSQKSEKQKEQHYEHYLKRKHYILYSVPQVSFHCIDLNVFVDLKWRTFLRKASLKVALIKFEPHTKKLKTAKTHIYNVLIFTIHNYYLIHFIFKIITKYIYTSLNSDLCCKTQKERYLVRWTFIRLSRDGIALSCWSRRFDCNTASLHQAMRSIVLRVAICSIMVRC